MKPRQAPGSPQEAPAPKGPQTPYKIMFPEVLPGICIFFFPHDAFQESFGSAPQTAQDGAHRGNANQHSDVSGSIEAGPQTAPGDLPEAPKKPRQAPGSPQEVPRGPEGTPGSQRPSRGSQEAP